MIMTQIAARQPTLSVSEAAERVGLSTHTLRWYEQEGPVSPVGRDSAGRRRYTEEDLGWLALLARLRRAGMRVRDMRRYAELARECDHALAEGVRVLQALGDRRTALLGVFD